MKILKDILDEVQVSAALRERIALRDERYEILEQENAGLRKRVAELESENAELRSKLPSMPSDDLSEVDEALLVLMFRSSSPIEGRPFEEPIVENELGFMARRLQLERGLVEYHLDRLGQRQLAQCTGGNYAYQHVYWDLTELGRAYVVEKGLLKSSNR